MPGLDGLRALAVFAVIAYHLNLKWAPGGLLGVCLFFVLSGYLITDLLAVQWSSTGRIDLKDFWLRRARRLLPALFVMLAGVVAWVALFAPERLTSLGEDVLAAVFYVSNWWLIFHQVSYFVSFGPPSPLGHLWSLAVEEQFYLIWPLLLWLGLRYVPRRRQVYKINSQEDTKFGLRYIPQWGRLVVLPLAGVLASGIAMALIYQPGTDPSRVYYGTDTRAFALLIGAALALVWPSRKLSAALSSQARRVLDIVGGAGLFVVLLMIWQTNEYESFLYRGGLLLFSLAAAVVVAVLAHPASRLGKIFGWQPLRWLGARSYGIYLWHYPVIALTNPVVNTGGFDLMLALRQVAISIVLAALSWYFIEEPIRHGAWKKWRGRILNPDRRQKVVAVRGWATIVGLLLILGISCLAIAGVIFMNSKQTYVSSAAPSAANVSTASEVPDEGSSGAVSPAVLGSPDPGQKNSSTSEPGSDSQANAPASESEGSNSTSPAQPDVNTPSGVAQGSKTEPNAATSSDTGKGVTVIGDSVMVGEEPELKKLLPGLVVSAEVGRQMYQAQNVVDQLKAQGNLGDRVIIELGTNGPFSEEQLTALLGSLGEVRQIVLVNTRVPRPWEDVVNQTLAKVAASYPHTTLVDWHQASSGHNAYFYPDGVHLTQTGIQAYASLVTKALNP
ncbi:acyltransferase family protein [Desulfosporosinus sp. PR]|nr:acyltransferase family protein [Desulfosporosinus sp. PR]MDQ7096776.1 acyltransferase family protein [Desulfosporosinus sp. PR]